MIIVRHTCWLMRVIQLTPELNFTLVILLLQPYLKGYHLELFKFSKKLFPEIQKVLNLSIKYICSYC